MRLSTLSLYYSSWLVFACIVTEYCVCHIATFVSVNAVMLFQEMGTIVIGKVESGTAKRGESFTMMPNKVCSSYLKFALGAMSNHN